MEVGHGGGRILAAAARHFKMAIGVDIHSRNEVVAAGLHARGISNFKLLTGDGATIPLEDNTVDVAYSFIVFQHLEKLEILLSYLHEIYRVLNTGGVAVLYFGRKRFVSYRRPSELLYRLDCLIERLYLRGGYREIPARVNSTNLVVSAALAKKSLRKAGFVVLKQMASRKNVPDGTHLYGGQHGFVARK